MFFSCEESVTPSNKSTTVHSDKSFFAIIEIPTGTTKKLGLDVEKNAIVQEKLKGKPKKLDFLPYPGNYGYIVNTHCDEDQGGDGEPLDVLILGETEKTGKKMEVLPIGVLQMKDKGADDSKIIAVPWERDLRIIKATDFATFITEYNAVQHILQEWFLNYKGLGNMELIGWKDEKFARTLIRKWSKKE